MNSRAPRISRVFSLSFDDIIFIVDSFRARLGFIGLRINVFF